MVPTAQDIIRACRYESGMTLLELAVAIDKNINTVFNWENGKSQPHFDSALEAIYAMGYEISVHKRG